MPKPTLFRFQSTDGRLKASTCNTHSSMSEKMKNESPARPRSSAALTHAAIIDIGSNSIRTMTAAMAREKLVFSEKTVHTTRLAEGLAQAGRLSNARMEQSIAVIRTFAAQMRANGFPVYAYATSAVRDALNRDVFAGAVCALIDGRLDILSGEQEARYAFHAAAGGGGMLDIGGGSTQIATQSAAYSFPIGCVRARDLCTGESLLQMQRVLYPLLDAFVEARNMRPSAWTGVGGSITTLAALAAGCTEYDRRLVNGFLLDSEMLTPLLVRLEALGKARASLPLLAKRHDVILYGGAILLYLMQRLQINRLCVSDADGLEGYAMHLFGVDNACSQDMEQA